MLIAQLSQLLILLWKLSSVFVIPLIMVGYVMVMNSYDESFTFEDLDQGKNFHKWLVLAIYLVYLLLWNRSNKGVVSYLKKLEY
ncbi:hypothetical protein [Psychromonas sp. Urea-02u-13]|uniref:hypothetical protein n=1 Tax=Psychromonas sp. Urea-02u-13 TaxID=2058326 RepID=UPI000C342269|nr:hypothetical protein [Psychromonas sp. Urea-02u-13]PKG39185.1 hypothetical protein CXF74_09770 [Psychromonas sp. Urea-02u-13]